ncbi:MAG TPA: acetyl-CoA hydrolase/transferase C-terminal domain-containing protein [Burkholderiales bacterium]|nr:acetyl-CoA hydrolase/transferase C-terminal domain-containing protein [Burkholderiales bacterium]
MDLASVIRPGDGLVWGQACAEPQTLVEALIAQREGLSGCGAFVGSSYSGLLRPEHADHLRISSYCGTGTNRALADAGVLDIVPTPYAQLGALLRGGRIKCDVVMVQVSPPNKRGEYSLGLAVEYLAPALDVARAVIAEVNDQIPWTHTQPLLRRSDFDRVLETSRKPVYLPYNAPGDLERRIAAHAAGCVPEAATIECGIGALPNAILSELQGRRDLRYHSGVVCELVRTLGAKRCLGGALMGTQELFDWARDNADLQLASSDITHGPKTLAGIDRFVAINSAVEVDLTGQVNGELARGSYVGAVGGALDFIRAANQSAGGVSIIALPAARIVERLAGPISVPRSEAGLFVTEHGVADLRGCSLREREKRMSGISGKS